jgi:DNA helicase-2/ATP-dependent DNA helicase PcrA
MGGGKQVDSLNPGQKAAVEHITGPCCVVAGAGSGKTTVLISRIANLVEEGVDPSNILAVTFTKKAADEMKERLAALIGDEACRVNMGTFHSVCYSILRREWQKAEQREPIQEYWQKKTIRDILSPPSRNNHNGMNWDLDVGQAMGFISWQKNNLIGPDGTFDNIAANEDKYRYLYKAYEEVNEREKKLDFDDMLLWCYQILKNNAGVRARYSTEFRYILVDEFQDTNLAQYEILKLLARPANNVFVVGDARQAIYSWRAARVDFILRFKDEWPGAKIIDLETNYRSTENIVSISNRLISGAGIKYPGRCKAHQGPQLDPVFMRSDDGDHEAGQIADEMQSLVDSEEYTYSDCAVLYRVNAQSQALEDALIASQIPYAIFGSTSFYQRKEVKDILAYLRILEDPNDAEAIARVLNVPKRYLGKVFLQKAQEYACRQNISLLDGLRLCPEAGQFKYRSVRDFLHCIDVLMRDKENFIPATMVNKVRETTGYDAWLCEEEGADEGADNQRLDNLDALAAAAERFGRLGDFIFYCEQAGSRKKDEDSADKVQLMTLHRSKGLEFPVVFLTGMIQGLLPHRRSCKYVDGEMVPESIEEERRLCYVGMTRAKERLYLSTMSTYRDKYAEPSMFLEEVLPANNLELKEGEVSVA